MTKLSNQQILNQFNPTSIYVTISKECGAASQIVYQTLTSDEQAQMQKWMSQSCKMQDGTLNIEDCPLTRKMFAGFYTTK